MGKGILESAQAAGYEGHATAQTFEALEHTPHVAQALAHTRTVNANRQAWDTEGWRRVAEEALEQARTESDLEAKLRWLDIAAKHLGIYTQVNSDAQLIGNVLAALTAPRERTRVLTVGEQVIESETGANGAGVDASEQGTP